MRYDRNIQRDKVQGDLPRELKLLEEIEINPQLTQRGLAGKLGVALGVANILVKSMTKKGYIKATQLGWKRWVYIVTPSGFSRKIALTLAYVKRFLDHYNHVRSMLREELDSLTLNAESRIGIYGTDELVELVYLSLLDMGITEIQILGHDSNGRRFLGLEIHEPANTSSNDYSLVIVASLTEDGWLRDKLIENGFSSSKIISVLQNQHTRKSVSGDNIL